MSNRINTRAALAFREGRLVDCYDVITRSGPTTDEDAVLATEALFLLGRSDEASAEANRLCLNERLAPSLLARCKAIVANERWYRGDFKQGLELYESACKLAESSKEISTLSRVRLQHLERTCDGTGYDSSLPLASLARRTVMRSDDPQIHALAHLTFGRLEAKAGRLSLAQRHFQLGRNLLSSAPNGYLEASIDLDESVALWLHGNIGSAIAVAERGSSNATKIGWSKGRLVAAGNLACLYVCQGKIAQAQQQIRMALKEQFLSLGAKNALMDTEARASIAVGNYAEAEKILSAMADPSHVQPWYRLTTELTRIELLMATGEWPTALVKTERSIHEADEAKLKPLSAAFRLARSEALLEAKGSTQGFQEVLSEPTGDWSFRLIGTFHSILGKALVYNNQSSRGTWHINRAIRILEGAGDLMAAKQVRERALPGSAKNIGPDVVTTSAGYLDATAALFELSGKVHVFGRELFALIKETSCCEACALVASQEQEAKIIEVHGWTPAEVLTAIKSDAGVQVVHVGRHGSETWKIVARQQTTLEHQCTFASIRKIASAAYALDQYRRDEKQRAALWPAEALDGDPESLWVSEQSLELVTLARRLASSHLPILITGETGTGKEMLARLIHRASNRAERPLVPVNCTAVPRELLESQLFGYRRGAFTGAETSFNGVIRGATGGTLFLDEIGDMNIDLQPKLLRFIELGEVHPLGEAQAVKVDVRIIAATNANLENLVAQGRFREDLLYRLKILTLALPPLRERREEIPALLQYYLQKCGDEQRKGRLTLSDETLEYLLLYSWPGNIRQLANEVRRMTALADPDSTITPSLLSPEIQSSRRTVPSNASADPEVRVRLDQPLPAAVDALEQSLVRHALQRSHGKVEEAARMLGISRKGLFLKRRRWGLQQAS